jgi:hypothetical protein
MYDFEIDALEVLAGKRECKVWGAAMNSTCEGLQEQGYLTEIPWRLTKKGSDFLKARTTPTSGRSRMTNSITKEQVEIVRSTWGSAYDEGDDMYEPTKVLLTIAEQLASGEMVLVPRDDGAELDALVSQGLISRAIATDVRQIMNQTGKSVFRVIHENGLKNAINTGSILDLYAAMISQAQSAQTKSPAAS